MKDGTVKGAITARIKRLEAGPFGDAAAVGDGVYELRIHVGAGWRVYYKEFAGQIVILLAGGTKNSQTADIVRAKQLASQFWQ